MTFSPFFLRLKRATVAAGIALVLLVPILSGFAVIHVSDALNTVSRHESAITLCQGLNETNANIQGFILDLSLKSRPPLTPTQAIELQKTLDTRFPQKDCTTFPLSNKKNP